MTQVMPFPTTKPALRIDRGPVLEDVTPAPKPRTTAGVRVPGTRNFRFTMLLPIGENSRSALNVRNWSA